MMHGTIIVEDTKLNSRNLSLYHTTDIRVAAYPETSTSWPFSIPFSLIGSYDNSFYYNNNSTESSLWLNTYYGSICLLNIRMNNIDSFSVKPVWSADGYQCVLAGEPNADNFTITIKKTK